MTEAQAKELRRRLASYRQCYAYEEFMPIPIWTDDEAVQRLVREGREDVEAMDVVSKWRALADEHDYSGPVLWYIPQGFVLVPGKATEGPCWRAGPKRRPLLGPLHEEMTLQYRSIGRHEETKNGFAFWIPRALKGTVSRSHASQVAVLSEVRKRYELPCAHLQGYGTLPLVSALMLANFLLTRTVVRGGFWQARTDTQSSMAPRPSRAGLYWHTSLHGFKSLRADWVPDKPLRQPIRDTFCYPLAFEPSRQR